MEYILAFSALLIGFLIAWFLTSRKLAEQRSAFEITEKSLIEAKSDAETQKSVALETLRNRDRKSVV